MEIDECELEAYNDCDGVAQCKNTGKGLVCDNVDVCEVVKCQANTKCVNLSIDFKSICEDGYSLVGKSLNVNVTKDTLVMMISVVIGMNVPLVIQSVTRMPHVRTQRILHMRIQRQFQRK